MRVSSVDLRFSAFCRNAGGLFAHFRCGGEAPTRRLWGEAREVHNLTNSLQLPPKLSTLYHLQGNWLPYDILAVGIK